MATGGLDRLRLTQELHALLIDYWHDVDTNWGRNAPEYYTQDAISSRPGPCIAVGRRYGPSTSIA